MDKDFEDFWQAYSPDEIRFPNRKQATYREWCKRFPATRQAMLDYVNSNNVPKWKNPYFFVQDFPDKPPTNYNGSHEYDNLVAKGKLCTAEFNGQVGIYSIEDAAAYHMRIIQRLRPQI